MVAQELLSWLEAPGDADWLDVGCGTGALTQTILETCGPHAVLGIDASPDYIAYARSHTPDERARFEVGDAREIPLDTATIDLAVSGLCLNFVPEPERAVAEMRRVTRPGGVVAAYVWDYAEGAQFIRFFWDAALEVDPGAATLDEGPRFPLCHRDALAVLFSGAGLTEVESAPIEVETRFRDFDDYWSPFTGGQGPAPAYAMSLPEEKRAELRERLRARLAPGPDGSIKLRARAWAVRGRA